METNEQNQNYSEATTNVEITSEALNFLDTTRKWTHFLSIIGFIFVGLLVIFGILAGTLFTNMGGEQFGAVVPGFMATILYLAFAVIYFFPVLYLYKFSINTKRAVESNNTRQITEALRFLKKHYKYLGILTIVIIGLYILIFLGVLAGGGLASMM